MTDRTTARALVTRFGVALVLPAAALAIWHTFLHAALPDPSVLLIVAVTIGGLYGGLWPGLAGCGLMAVGLSVLYPGHELRVIVAVALAGFLDWLVAPLQKVQLELKEQIDFTQTITRSLGEGILAIDRHGKITFVNNATEQLLGWNRSELQGKSGARVFGEPSDGKESPPSPLDVLKHREAVTGNEAEFHRRGGSTLPVSFTASPMIRRGRLVGALVAFRDMAEQRRALHELREEQERYQSLVATSPDSIVLSDMYGFVTMANQRSAEIYGYDEPQEMIGLAVGDLVAPVDRKRAMEDRLATLDRGTVRNAEYLAVRRDGSTFLAQISSSLIEDSEGRAVALTSFVRDITDQKHFEETLRASGSRLSMQYSATRVLAEAASVDEAVWRSLQTVAQHSGWDVGVYWTIDRRHNVLRCAEIWHPPWISIPEFSYLSRSLTFAPGDGMLGGIWERPEWVWIPDVVGDKQFTRALMASKEHLHGCFAFPIQGQSGIHGVLEFFSREVRGPDRDLADAISTIGTQIGQFFERKQAEEALAHQALHDALTDLPNRTLLMDRLQQAILAGHRKQRSVSLLVMDLDRFKEVNDTLGHHYGDMLLQEAGLRLRHTLRESDTVARLGGDEFAILLPETEARGAILAAEKVLSSLGHPFAVEGQSLDIGVSIGIAVYPTHGDDRNTVMRRADVAMYVAKRAGTGYALYESQLDEYSASRLALMGELRQAIEHGQLLVHYQPKVSMRTGELESVEALVRWQHPKQGLLPPDEFVNLAEHIGLIQVLSLQVLSSALRQCREWREAGLTTRVAVNLSARSLHDQQLVGMIAGTLRTCDAEPSWLEVEITEGAVMADSERSIDVLTRLHEMGVRIALDDFGTGYSALSYLRNIPADEIKIDKSFVLELAVKNDTCHIVRSVVELGKNMGLQVVAEGVENQETWEILRSMDCDLAQGTFVSPPVPPEELLRRFGGPQRRLSTAIS